MKDTLNQLDFRFDLHVIMLRGHKQTKLCVEAILWPSKKAWKNIEETVVW